MRLTLITILLCFMLLPGAWGEAPVAENALKAAYIYHFLNFTQWDDDMKNYYVCVPDNEPLRRAVESTLLGKTVNRRPILVLPRSGACHVLVSDYPVPAREALTIGRLGNGALIEFRIVNNKLKFAVNPERIRRSKLKISSQLLKLAILDGP